MGEGVLPICVTWSHGNILNIYQYASLLPHQGHIPAVELHPVDPCSSSLCLCSSSCDLTQLKRWDYSREAHGCRLSIWFLGEQVCLSFLVGLSSFLVSLWMPVQKVKGCREQEECICLSGFCLLFSLFNCTKKQWLLKARFIHELDDWFFVIGSMANNHCTVLKRMWSLQEPVLLCGVREGNIDHEPWTIPVSSFFCSHRFPSQ